MKEAPIKIREVEKLPHEGKSYNPSFDAWKSLINIEFSKELPKEEQRQKLIEHQEKIQYLIETLDSNEIDDDSDDESNSGKKTENEDDEDDEDNEDEDENRFKVSVNPAVKNKKKTKTQRNKQKRHKQRELLESQLKELKARIKQLETIPEPSTTESITASKATETPAKTKQQLANERRVQKETRKLGSKHTPLETPLEVKLSDELSDSLRTLKPEGNLLYDQMNKLQSSGMVEVRKQSKQKRKYKKKVTEKWTYKDFKW
ncbi:unnamed protein product [Ambrosiozyma monospora]|uniref:Unnamed protein product n=1 Tax=Ambrosiozyma monospora TaxID=43982 RepID=A0ACB5TSE1_AMBMO|nr:unnamed protein product [Ambrosiozyma monospora]